MHTVVENNKKYIGITSQKPDRRWGNNGIAYTKTQYFAKAIKKYGWDNIKHEILFTNLTKEEAEQKEIELIAYYDTTNHDKGYNIAKGGHGTLGVVASEETRKKLSISHKLGKRPRAIPIICLTTNIIYSSIGEAAERTGCSKSCIRDCLIGRKKQTGGLQFDYVLEKDRKPKIQTMSKKEAAMLASIAAKKVNGIKIAQYDLEGNFLRKFESAKDAAKFVGLKTPKKILKCARGQIESAYDYIWQLYTES